MTAVSLTTLTTRAQQRAVMENHVGVSSTEWTSYINAACSETHRLLVRQHGQERFATSLAYEIGSDDKAYTTAAPPVLIDTSSWLGILSVHLTYPSGRSIAVVPFEQVDRDRKPLGQYPWTRDAIRYRPVGTAIEFEPAGVAESYTGTIRYIEGFVALVNGADTWDGRIQGWDDRVVLRAALLARTKLRMDASDLVAELGMLTDDLSMTSLNFNRGGAIRTPRRSRW